MLLGIEDILCELASEETGSGHGFPPGFRFHPTDEELITFYLASKVFHGSCLSCPVDIAEVDLNKCEPWDLPDEAKMGKREWYFYSLRDRKYPTGLRTNRATSTGYWKATGKDKEIHNAAGAAVIGMKKTLVFYLGRAPRGQKTKWVMHEYRLHGDFSFRAPAKEEWVICRICHKTCDKKNMHLNELGGGGGGSQQDLAQMASSFMAINETFLPQLIDSQQFLQNHTTLQHIYNNNPPIQSDQLSPLTPPAYHYSSTNDTSMLIKSDMMNHNLKQFTPEQAVKTESNFPNLLSGAADHGLEWFNEFQQASSTRYNNHNPLYSDTNGGDGESSSIYVPQMSSTCMDLSQGGCLQMVVDPHFRILTGESAPLDS